MFRFFCRVRAFGKVRVFQRARIFERVRDLVGLGLALVLLLPRLWNYPNMVNYAYVISFVLRKPVIFHIFLRRLMSPFAWCINHLENLWWLIFTLEDLLSFFISLVLINSYLSVGFYLYVLMCFPHSILLELLRLASQWKDKEANTGFLRAKEIDRLKFFREAGANFFVGAQGALPLE